jgi:hypothetical protein
VQQLCGQSWSLLLLLLLRLVLCLRLLGRLSEAV